MVKRLVRRVATAACALMCLASLPAQAAIWEAQNEWTEDHERAYAEWSRTEFDKDYFHKPEQSTVFGLALDCSDAIYAMRIMYAYENSLPFAINDPTGKRRTLTNEFSKWDGYRETRREELDDGSWRTYQGPEYTEADKVRAFIEYIGDVTSTLNLVNDTYPVSLSDIQPGDMFLLPRNHAYIVKNVEPTGAMTTLSHSSPRAWRVMAEINDFPAEVPEDSKKRDGYRRFKPIDMLRTPGADIPGASEEQWEIAARLGGSREAFALATQEALASIKGDCGGGRASLHPDQQERERNDPRCDCRELCADEPARRRRDRAGHSRKRYPGQCHAFAGPRIAAWPDFRRRENPDGDRDRRNLRGPEHLYHRGRSGVE